MLIFLFIFLFFSFHLLPLVFWSREARVPFLLFISLLSLFAAFFLSFSACKTASWPVARRPDTFWFVREEIIVKIPCGLIFDEITLPGSVDSPDDTAKVEYFVAVGPAAMFASRRRHFADGFFQPVGGGKRGERRRGRLSRLFCKVKCINSDERLRPRKPLCRNVQ